MIRPSRTLPLVALPALVGLAAVPVGAQRPLVPPAPATASNLPATAQQRLLVSRLQAARSHLDTVLQRFKAGAETQPAVTRAEAEVRDLELQIAALEESVALETRIAALNRPVDVELKSASVQQAAEALTKATRTPIRVAEDVPAERRISLEASGVPLARVVEAIARANHLMIAPDPKDSRGILLRQWPSLVVNGERKVYMAPTAPWSEEWFPFDRSTPSAPFLRRGAVPEGAPRPFDMAAAMPTAPEMETPPAAPGGAPLGPPAPDPGAAPGGAPTAPAPTAPAPAPPGTGSGLGRGDTLDRRGLGGDGLDGRRGFGGGLGGGFPASEYGSGFGPGQPFDPATSSAYPGMPGFSSPSRSGSVSIASLGPNLFVVAEPAAGPALESGVWLTVYRLEGQKLVRVVRQFHAGPVLRPGGPVPSPPGTGAPGKGTGGSVRPPGQRVVSLTLRNSPLRTVIPQLFAGGGEYAIDPEVPNIPITLQVRDVTLDSAVTTLVKLVRSQEPRLKVSRNGTIYVFSMAHLGPHVPLPSSGVSKKVTVSLRKVPFREAVREVFAGTGLQHSISPRVPEIPISLGLRDVDFDSALQVLLRLPEVQASGVTASLQNGGYHFDAPSAPEIQAVPAPAAPGEPAPPQQSTGPAALMTVTLTAREAPLRRVLDQLFSGRGLSYAVSGEVPDVPITLNIRGAEFEPAVRAVVKLAGEEVPGLVVSRAGEVYVVRIPRMLPALSTPIPATGGPERRVSLTLTESGFRDALRTLFDGSGLQYAVASTVPNVPVSLDLREVRFHHALQVLLWLAEAQVPGLALNWDGRVYHFDASPAG